MAPPKNKPKPQGRINKVILLKSLLAGKTKKDSARDAGSLSNKREALIKVANRAIKDPLFREILDKGISDNILVKRLKEGIDAKRAIVVDKKEVVGDKVVSTTKIVQVPDLGMRLNYIDRVIDLKDLKPHKEEPPQNPGGVFVKIDQILNDNRSQQSGGNTNPYK